MAAQQQQQEAVVSLRAPLVDAGHEFCRKCAYEHPSLALAASLVASDTVDQAARRDRREPRRWVVGHASDRPLISGLDQGVLYSVLAEVEGLVATYERAEDMGSKAPQQILDAPVVVHSSGPDSCKMGHTSTALCEANGYSPAISKARSSLATSRRKKLDTNSLAST